MKRFSRLAAIMVSAVTVIPLLAQAGHNQQTQSAPEPQKPASASAPDRGQQVFEQNCSRCHNPPEGFSPRISGTVALHMRVRANLSDRDYKELLHFLNP
jgi:mono/diheme cytochrome c family protein